MAGISWIKLSVNIFDDEKIKLIRKMPEGDAILLIWIQLLCLAGKTNDGGAIYIGQHLYYTDEMLATICDQPLNTVRLAIQTFQNFGMISTNDNGLIVIDNWEKHQNIEGMERVREQNRLRKRKQREKEKKQLEESKDKNNVTGQSRDVTQQTRIDKNKNRQDKNKNRIEIDYNNNNDELINTKNITRNEKLVVDYFYTHLKNNTSRSDWDLAVSDVKKYGWPRVLYTLYYLKTEQNARITNFSYVDKVLKTQKEPDKVEVEFIANREIKKLRSEWIESEQGNFNR